MVTYALCLLTLKSPARVCCTYLEWAATLTSFISTAWRHIRNIHSNLILSTAASSCAKLTVVVLHPARGEWAKRGLIYSTRTKRALTMQSFNNSSGWERGWKSLEKKISAACIIQSIVEGYIWTALNVMWTFGKNITERKRSRCVQVFVCMEGNSSKKIQQTTNKHPTTS